MGILDTLLDDIHAGRVQPRTHVVARRLVELERIDDPLARKILHAFDDGNTATDEDLLSDLWSKIDSLELAKQGGFRTLVFLLQPDAEIDGYNAEYLVAWAGELGVAEDAIDFAFRKPA